MNYGPVLVVLDAVCEMGMFKFDIISYMNGYTASDAVGIHLGRRAGSFDSLCITHY